MESRNKIARIAGFVYLMVVVNGIFSLAYVPSRLIVWNNASATFQNIVASETLFRFGIVSSLICYIFFLILPLVLYQLLKTVNEVSAKLMVIFALMSIPISFINLQNKYNILSLIKNEEYLKNFGIDQLQSQLMFYLDSYNQGILIVQIFWGLWLLPFGYLVVKSDFLPKILGFLLMAGCFGYLISVFGRTIFPQFDSLIIARYITMPASLGEIGICLWLLISGVKKNKSIEPKMLKV